MTDVAPPQPPAADSELGGRVMTGARWIGLLRIGTMATTWITTIALARFLDPSEYGLVGMAGVAITIFTLFQDSGLHAALIQRRERVQEAVDAATAYTPVLGVFLFVVCFAAAPLAGLLFHRHEVTDLVRVLSVVFLLRAVSQVPMAILHKELLFGRFTAVTLSGALLQMGVVIALAARGAGAWSVIVGQIVLAGWSALLLWPLCPMRPHPRNASLRDLRELLHYGRHIVGANISGFVNSYVDIVVVGRLLGAASLGAYTLGFQTGKQAVATVTYASNQVIFPAYSKLQDDPGRFRRAYLRSLRFITVVSVPAGFGLAAVSGEFVRVVYGERWHAAAPVLAIIALMGVVLSITATMGEVLKATGQPNLFFRMSLLQTTLVFVTVLGLYRFGIAAVAAALAISVTITGLAVTAVTGRTLDIGPLEWIRTLLPSVVAGGAMVAAILATKAAIATTTSTSTLPVLALLVVEGTAVYLAALRVVGAGQLREFFGELGRLAAVPHLRARLRLRSET